MTSGFELGFAVLCPYGEENEITRTIKLFLPQ